MILKDYLYYQDDAGEIYCGDCLEIMPLLADKSIDLVLTDPPYGIDYLSPWTENHSKIENDKLDDWKEILPQFFTESKRILSDTGCCCCCCGGGGKTPVTALFTIEAIKHFHLIQTLVWRKFIGLGWRYRPAYENIVILSKDKDNYNFYDTSKACGNVVEGINQDIPQNGDHPTRKPVELMAKLLLTHSLEGQRVIDPFAGGGSLLAYKRLNRRFIGIEISEKYCEIAKEQVAE